MSIRQILVVVAIGAVVLLGIGWFVNMQQDNGFGGALAFLNNSQVESDEVAQLREELAQKERELAAAQAGTDTSGMEAQIASLQAQIAELESDRGQGGGDPSGDDPGISPLTGDFGQGGGALVGCPTNEEMQAAHGFTAVNSDASAVNDVLPVFIPDSAVWDPCQWNWTGSILTLNTVPGWQYTVRLADGTVAAYYGDGSQVGVLGFTARYMAAYSTSDPAQNWIHDACLLLAFENKYSRGVVPAYDTLGGNISCSGYQSVGGGVVPTRETFQGGQGGGNSCPTNAREVVEALSSNGGASSNVSDWNRPDATNHPNTWVWSDAGTFKRFYLPSGTFDYWDGTGSATFSQVGTVMSPAVDGITWKCN